MVENYDWVLELNHRDLFNDLLEKSKLAVMCLLMNEKLRSYYLPIEMKKEDGTVINDLTAGSDKFVMYSSICAMIKNGSLEEELGDNLHIFSDSVKDNDCCVNRISDNRQHTCDKCVTNLGS